MSFFGVDEVLFNGVKTLQAWTAHLMLFCSCVWQALRAHQSLKKNEFDDYIFTPNTRDEWEDQLIGRRSAEIQSVLNVTKSRKQIQHQKKEK